jgi:hypothetical protein
MARKLKTYVTNLGFFELALAAPSMKAALEAWGMGHNAFHQGFARESDDPRIVAAAMAKPGVVLKRPVGSKGAFTENARLPKDWMLAPPKGELPKRELSKAKPKAAAKKTQRPKAAETGKGDEKAGRAAIISFEKEKARRARAREKEAAAEDARAEKDRVRRERDVEKARSALDRAETRHEEAMAALERARDKLDRRMRAERERWDAERDELKAALREAGD